MGDAGRDGADDGLARHQERAGAPGVAPCLGAGPPGRDGRCRHGFVFAGPRGRAVRGLDEAMRSICTKLGVERATPHDLRRTFSTTVTGLGFGRDALNRVTNHREGGIASVYDRHGYAEENKRVMEATAARIMALVKGGVPDDQVVPFPVKSR